MTNKELFKQRFIANFLASYCTENYSDACSHNQHDRLRNPPVEDAEHLAECAWEKCCEHLNWQEEEIDAPAPLQGSAYVEFRRQVREALNIANPGVMDRDILAQIQHLMENQ